MKQTAVEWYEKEVNSLIEKYEAKEISKRDFITMKHNLFYPAKELEKQQIINCCKQTTRDCFISVMKSFGQEIVFTEQDLKNQEEEGKQYYNQKFKNEIRL